MLGKSCVLGKWKGAKSWQAACYQSNARVHQWACRSAGAIRPAAWEVELLRDSVRICTPDLDHESS
jgi:hypothetical protein